MRSFPKPLLLIIFFALLHTQKAITADPELPRLDLSRKPLLDLPVKKVIHVKDFGAIPDDGQNDASQIQAAIQKAVDASTPCEIRFEPGTYLLQGDQPAKHCLALKNAKDLLINGNGALFIVQNPNMGFLSLTKLRNSIIKNMVIDYDPLPFTQGTILEVNSSEGYVVVRKDEGFADFTEPYFHHTYRTWCSVLDPKIPGRFKPLADEGHTAPKGVEKLSGDTFKITISRGDIEAFGKGDKFTLQGRENSSKIFNLTSCERVTFSKITYYTSPSSGYVGPTNDEIYILDCKVLIKKGRWQSGISDIVHLPGSKTGPWVENCVFEGCGDDPMHIYSSSGSVQEIIHDQIRVDSFYNLGEDAKLDGSKMYLFRGSDGTYLGEHEIKNASSKDGKSWTLTLPSGTGKILKKEDLCWFENYLNRNTVVKNNVIRNSFRLGTMYRGHSILLENNTYEGLSASGPQMVNHSKPEHLLNGFVRGDIIIRGNTIRDCDFGETYLLQRKFGAICISWQDVKHNESKSQGINRVLIENNRILNWRRQGIHVDCAQNLTIRGNQILTENSLTPLDPYKAVVKGKKRGADNITGKYYGIYVNNSSHVLIENNTIKDPRSISGAVYFENGNCTEVEVQGTNFEK